VIGAGRDSSGCGAIDRLPTAQRTPRRGQPALPVGLYDLQEYLYLANYFEKDRDAGARFRRSTSTSRMSRPRSRSSMGLTPKHEQHHRFLYHQRAIKAAVDWRRAYYPTTQSARRLIDVHRRGSAREMLCRRPAQNTITIKDVEARSRNPRIPRKPCRATTVPSADSRR